MGKKQPARDSDKSDIPVAAVQIGFPTILAAEARLFVWH
jgi:hypothetical protein